MSKIYRMAKKYYETIQSNGKRIWNSDQLRTLVEKKKLTKKEYEKITGEPYDTGD